MDEQDPMVTEEFLAEVGKRVVQLRFQKEMTQEDLARESGVSKRTIERLEAGESVQLTSFIRICRALGIVDRFDILLPEARPSPIQELKLQGKERQRVRKERKGGNDQGDVLWSWGDEA